MLASVRRSLFTGDDERQAYLAALLQGCIHVLENVNMLLDSDCYHQFCRLMARIKSNFQLRELVACEGYKTFIEKVALFTMESFRAFKV